MLAGAKFGHCDVELTPESLAETDWHLSWKPGLDLDAVVVFGRDATAYFAICNSQPYPN